jgi:ATP-binding cassette subfamily F protein 3
MIQVDNISKSYAGQVLFENISFKLNSRERLGLVGRNGHGKTTLFRLIIGSEHPDAGSISVPRNYRIGYVRQQLAFTRDTVLEEGASTQPESESGQYWKVEKILAGLGFSQTDLGKHPSTLSGGYQVRLNFAKALVSDPDLLLLDEPTNYLDITSIRWVVKYLNTWPHELMLITHDRSFMDQVVTHTMGIHRRRVRKIAGDTAKYYHQIAQDEEIYEKTRVKNERRRKETQQFINRFRAKARLANLVQSRIKTLQKMEDKQKLEKIASLEFTFRYNPFPARHVLSARRVGFGYNGQKPLIENFNLTINAGERLCVVGPNGKGKSTLLKLLAGSLPVKTGEIIYHPAVTKGFFGQTDIHRLVDSRTVEQEVQKASPDVDRQLARNICGAMMFSGDDALKKVSVLSGGEKSRVMLAKILVTPVNLLLLDEPTNHLDMESCDAMLAAIDSWEGTVIIATHNEMFLHALAERLIVFQNDDIEVFNGSYQQFLAKVGWADEARPAPTFRPDDADNGKTEKQTKKDARRKRSEIMARRSKTVRPLEQRLSKLETEIETREKELDHLSQSMQVASQDQDGRQIAELSRAIHQCRAEIDRLFSELETATDELERQSAVFRQLLDKLS